MLLSANCISDSILSHRISSTQADPIISSPVCSTPEYRIYGSTDLSQRHIRSGPSFFGLKQQQFDLGKSRKHPRCCRSESRRRWCWKDKSSASLATSVRLSKKDTAGLQCARWRVIGEQVAYLSLVYQLQWRGHSLTDQFSRVIIRIKSVLPAVCW